MELLINNAVELKAEIARLKLLKEVQTEELKQRFSSPSAIFSTLRTLFPKAPEGSKDSSIFNIDLYGILSRFLLPLTLNKTIFRKSNFLVKALVGLVSQKASHFISEDSVTSIWGKVKSIFEKKKVVDYGIPAGSKAS